MALNRRGRDRFLRKFEDCDQLPNTYSLNNKAARVAFTTNTSASGVSHYQQPQSSGMNPSGSSGATSSGLNPFGLQDAFSGVISRDNIGTGLFSDLVIDPTKVRSFGRRTPWTYVGWGYDVMGRPAPNSIRSWDASGIYSDIDGSGTFRGSGEALFHGRDVPKQYWKAGPVDLRWDQHRGVWTSYYGGTMIGRVKNIHIDGGTYDPTGVYAAEDVTYDVETYDGEATRFVLSDVPNIGPRPEPDTYHIRPLPSGAPCFIVHHPDAGDKPDFALWAIEPPATIDCDTVTPDPGGEEGDSYGGPGDGEPWNSEKILTGTGLFQGLANEPMPLAFGGLGISSISDGEIILGASGGGSFERLTLTTGSGIAVTRGGGNLQIKIDDAVNFDLAGINTTITELQGLTTPLSIAQGGTGASGLVFVDLDTDQTVEGYKGFASGIAVRSGPSATLPGISFLDTIGVGVRAATGTPSFFITSSGKDIIQAEPSGSWFKTKVLIYDDDPNPDYVNSSPALIIRQNDYFTEPTGGTILRVEDRTGLDVLNIDQSGYLGINRPMIRVSGEDFAFPAVGGEILTDQSTINPSVSGITDNIVIDNVTLNFENGILVGYSVSAGS